MNITVIQVNHVIEAQRERLKKNDIDDNNMDHSYSDVDNHVIYVIVE